MIDHKMSEELEPLEDLKERYNELKEQARQVDAELTLRKENLGKLGMRYYAYIHELTETKTNA